MRSAGLLAACAIVALLGAVPCAARETPPEAAARLVSRLRVSALVLDLLARGAVTRTYAAVVLRQAADGARSDAAALRGATCRAEAAAVARRLERLRVRVDAGDVATGERRKLPWLGRRLAGVHAC